MLFTLSYMLKLRGASIRPTEAGSSGPGTFIVVPQGSLSRKYVRGTYQLMSGSTLLVSRRVGCSTLPFRVYSAPDVIVCTVAPSGRA